MFFKSNLGVDKYALAYKNGTDIINGSYGNKNN